MKTKALLCTFIAASTLVGCAMHPTIDPGSQAAAADCPDTINPRDEICTQSLCAIPVQVVLGTDGKCEVVVGSPTMRVYKGNHGDGDGVVLFWWLPLTSKYEFRPESGAFTLPINFKDQADPDLRGQFSTAQLGPNGGSVRVIDKNTVKKTFNYRIRVYKKGGPAGDPPLESKDPAIVNDAN